MRPKLSYSNVIATLCLIALVSGTAVAATNTGSGANSTITACAAKKGGALRVVGAKKKCGKAERKLSWSAGATSVPSGAVAYFDLPSCPSGWTEFASARGRYVVGLNPGGGSGKTVGTALSDGENRPTGEHTHTINDPGHVHSAAVDPYLAGGGVTVKRFQGTDNEEGGIALQSLSTDVAKTGITINPAGSVPGTNAPYVQLLTCRKS